MLSILSIYDYLKTLCASHQLRYREQIIYIGPYYIYTYIFNKIHMSKEPLSHITFICRPEREL